MPILRCSKCEATYPTTAPRWRCDCGSPLRLEGCEALNAGRMKDRPPGLRRYTEALGLDDPENAVTLGEGSTPLLGGELEGLPVLFKLDYLCPTGSFKDRGCAVMTSKLREWSVREIVVDSSGNAGASVAAYAAAAGIRANIFIPAEASAVKAAQIALYGANLVRITGTREDTAEAALEAGRRCFYASHNWSPFFVAGLRTVAFEIAEQLRCTPPDWVVAPLGGGGLILGLFEGFTELSRAGLTARLPRLAGVQSEACAPVYRAWRAGLREVPSVKKAETLAEGISIARPVKGREILSAIRASNGVVRCVSDSAIRRMLQALGKKGLFVEPTSAAAPAAVAGMAEEGLLSPGQSIVIVLTGIGLKATEKILQVMAV